MPLPNMNSNSESKHAAYPGRSTKTEISPPLKPVATATNPASSSGAKPRHKPVSPHRRTGKIARLPLPQRNLINQLLRDGMSYSKIIQQLGSWGAGLNVDNLSRWHAGGFQDWLKEHKQLDELQAKLELASDILEDNDGCRLHEAALRIAVAQLLSLLSQFRPDQLHPTDDLVNYIRVLHLVTQVTQMGLKFERHRLDQTSAF
jgi:hypothetical protein